MAIPAPILRLIHDCDPASLSWERHRDFLIDRVLASDNWEAICCLREEVSDERLADRIRRTRGRKLSPRQLRFWQVVLDLDAAEVMAWIHAPGRESWDGRSDRR